jgi:2-polyprenyl-6-methoxyphenol hydroxylase-like FAD-dependent oxidoreductase
VTFTSRVAERFREGRGFLVGDAAHQATPRGGTGLNAALQDGFDLGWRLAWTLRGWADPGLLDGYEAERRPLVEHSVSRSADPDWTGPARQDWDAAPAALDPRVPVRVRCLDPVTARALGIRDGGALLTRPDGVPAGAGRREPTRWRALSAGIASATGRARAPRAAALAA